jgi:DnaJ-class molecular chaperone
LIHAAATPLEPDAETIQTLLDLLNPLHGELDRQTYDERLTQDFDAPREAEYSVNITAQMERDLTQAVLILEDRMRQAALPDEAATMECPKCHDANKYGDYEGPTCEVCMGDGRVPVAAIYVSVTHKGQL